MRQTIRSPPPNPDAAPRFVQAKAFAFPEDPGAGIGVENGEVEAWGCAPPGFLLNPGEQAVAKAARPGGHSDQYQAQIGAGRSGKAEG